MDSVPATERGLILKPVVIFGTGQLADLSASYFQGDSELEVIAFVSISDDAPEGFRGHPVVPLANLSSEFSPEEISVFVAVSYHDRNSIRRELVMKVSALGYESTSYVSSAAHIWSDVAVGSNCLVLEGTCVQPGCIIRDGAFIWTGVQIGHHSTIGAFSFISAGAVLMGCNELGECAQVGGGAVLYDHITVGDRSVVRPGVVLRSSLAEGQLIENSSWPIVDSGTPENGV